MAYCKRFARNAKSTADKIYRRIRGSEINDTTICIIKVIQAKYFKREISDFRKLHPLHPKIIIIRIKPFLDENRLIKMVGRHKNVSTVDVFKRFPIVLPA